MMVDKKELVERLSRLVDSENDVLILGHPHADPDAVSSVMALGKMLDSYGADVSTGIPKNLNDLSNSILDSLDEDIDIDPSLDADVVIVLDTSDLDLLEGYGERLRSEGCEMIFIDHHRPDADTVEEVDMYYCEEGATSNAEMVLGIGDDLGYEFDSRTSLLLLTGVMSDTAHLRFAEEDTFRAVVRLLENGADYGRALDILETPVDPSKTVAMLKAVERATVHKAHGRWIVFSELGAYESDAASMFVKIGSDVSAVFGEKDDGSVRMSVRADDDVCSETGLHLGELMSDLADEFGGTGGGHEGAAGLTVDGGLEDVKEATLGELEKRLSSV